MVTTCQNSPSPMQHLRALSPSNLLTECCVASLHAHTGLHRVSNAMCILVPLPAHVHYAAAIMRFLLHHLQHFVVGEAMLRIVWNT